jgi:hypothetical protein
MVKIVGNGASHRFWTTPAARAVPLAHRDPQYSVWTTH